MAGAIFIDSNIILRHVIGDAPAQAAACRDLFRAVEAGRRPVWTTHQAIAECVYVLTKMYQTDRRIVAGLLRKLIDLPGFGLDQKRVIHRAFDLFVAHPNIDYDDCYHAALVLSRGETQIMSFDRHFDRLPGVERVEPRRRSER